MKKWVVVKVGFEVETLDGEDIEFEEIAKWVAEANMELIGIELIEPIEEEV